MGREVWCGVLFCHCLVVVEMEEKGERERAEEDEESLLCVSRPSALCTPYIVHICSHSYTRGGIVRL
jgi:hypothetical protein